MATPTIKWSRHQRERISKTLNELSFEPVFFPGGRRISVFGQEADDAEKRVGEMDFLRNGNDLEVKLRLRMHGYKVEVSIHSKPVDYVFEDIWKQLVLDSNICHKSPKIPFCRNIFKPNFDIFYYW